MFWKFGGYASISPIDSILDRPQFALEDLLDENDLLGDIKARNGKLLDYLRKREVLERLLEFVVAPKAEPAAVPIGDDTKDDSAGASDDASNERGRPRLLPFNRPRASSSLTDGGRDDDEAETKRNRYAYVSCEILSCDNWSICETVMDPSNRDLLHKFWQYIKQPALLDPLQASYFTKVNESLFDKKVDDMVVFLKSMDGAVQDMLRHVDCPMIMDLLLKIITLDRPEGSPGIVEWLYTQDVMPTLLSFLSPKNSWATQTSAGDFIKAIITVSANATQNEQTCIGPNELTRQLVSHPCIDELINYMLSGGNALTVGVGIIIEVIRKNNSDYDPDVGTEANSIPSSRDPIYLGTLLRMFAENVPNFMQLMNNAPAQKTRLNSTFNVKIEPLGFDRFKTCELMAELLHCSNMGLLNEFGSETVIAVRDAERKRLRSEGKLAPNRGEDAIAPGTDLLTMRVSHAPAAEEGRRLEIMNVSASDEDGFEEVTHTADMGEDEKQQYNVLPLTGPRPSTSSLFEKDDDDFVDEPLSSPRLNTRDDKLPELELPHFDEPDLVVAPLSPTKKKVLSQFSDPEVSKDSESSSTPSTVDNESIDNATVSSDDFVTEATEPALGKGAKPMSDADKGDESDAGIVFTPTISSLSESFHSTAQRSSSPISELREQLAKTIISEEDIVLEQAEEVVAKETLQEDNQAPTAPLNELMPYSTEPAHEASKNAGESKANAVSTTDATEKRAAEENERDAGNESIVVAPRPVEASSKLSTMNATADEPVVGDLLKIQFVEHRVVPTILSFFFSYPWNNFLHNVVYDVVQQVFNGPMDRGFNPNLAISLFESADVTTQIINGQLASEKSQVSTRTRMGYMGHLTLIAEEVVKFTERHPPELLSEVVLEKVMSQDWINYVEGPLAETRERDNAILGGVRPDVSMGNQAGTAGLAAVGLSGLGSSFGMGNTQNTSSALADAGLNGSLDFQGEADGGLGPFSISAGISSGFHSSSDEDEDDNDDNDEDINDEANRRSAVIENSTGNFVHTGDDCKDDEEGQVNIDVDIIFGGAYGSDGDFRAYTDSLNASSSLIPPAIPPPPPPPPPLNIPPSRARLQLAARLAMSKRNAEAAAAQDGHEGCEDDDNGGDSGFGRSGSQLLTGTALSGSSGERLRNPFADDEDDEDDEDDDEDDEEDDDADTALNGGRGGGRTGLGWNRGSWWRSMVRGDRNAASSGVNKSEKFGDGRDSSSDEDSDHIGPNEARSNVGRNNDDDDDDEEFGDFAMAEVSAKDDIGGREKVEGGGNSENKGSQSDAAGSSSGNGATSGGLYLDSDPDTVLFKPLAVHPPSSNNTTESSSGGSGGTTVSGLWPFERLRFLTNTDAEKDEQESGNGNTNANGSSVNGYTDADAKGKDASSADYGDGMEVLSEDGHKVSCVTEAARRTSLEGPDEDEVVV